MLLQMALFHSFSWLSSISHRVCVCVYTPHLLYPFVCWWTSLTILVMNSFIHDNSFPLIFQLCISRDFFLVHFLGELENVWGLPCWLRGLRICLHWDPGSVPGLGRSPVEGNDYPLLPGEFHEQRSLVGYSPWGHRVRHNWATNTRECYLIRVWSRFLWHITDDPSL